MSGNPLGQDGGLVERVWLTASCVVAGLSVGFSAVRSG